MRVHCGHVIAKWNSPFHVLHFTWLGGFSVSVSEREQHRQPQGNPDSHTLLALAQNTADGQVARGESEVGDTSNFAFELGANIKLLL